MIFEDPTRRRWRTTLVVFALATVTSIVLFGTFVVSLVLNPPLAVVGTQRAEQAVNRIRHRAVQLSRKQKPQHFPRRRLATATGGVLSLPRHGSGVVTAFLLQGDPQSVASFKEQQQHIDVVFPDWFSITKSTCTVDEHIDPDVSVLLSASSSAIMPRVTNVDESAWHTGEIRHLLRRANTRSCIVELLASFAKKGRFRGLNMDIEALGVQDRDNYLEFLHLLAAKLHAQRQLLTVDVTT